MKSAYRQHGGTLLGMFIGLVLGVLISFGVVWYLNQTPLPFRDKGARVDRSGNGENGQSGSPAALPGKPGDKVGEKAGDKPRFEFYKILPGSQDAAPAGTTARSADTQAETKPADSRAGADKPAAEPLYLQIGAFQKPADAENLKAKLALMGIDASIQEAEVADKGKMYRVRTGPFSSVEELNRLRKELSHSGIQAAQVKGK